MDLQTITLPKHEARQAVADYRRALLEEKHAALRKEDEAILRGYRAIARGQTIISLPDAIRRGGEFSSLLPKLAISRADEKRVQVRRRRDGSVSFAADFVHPPRAKVDLGDGTLSRIGFDRWNRDHRGRTSITASAIVPSIPPALRPNADLGRYWILFEAEWSAVAPRDPALLRPLGGGLYAVVATWDLTDLERAVLGMTRADA